MHLVQIPEKRIDIIYELIEQSVFTFEGIDISDKHALKKLEKMLCGAGLEGKNSIWYWCKGDWFNQVFGLTDSNAYPSDLTFLMIPDFYNTVVKKVTGARWLDDIVCNNRIKQNAINFGMNPDFDSNA